MEIKEIKDNTYSITVPRGIRYLSDWKEFNLFEFPYILDKQIPGCGFTEFCLTNNQDLVLMSPRKILLENKYDQHRNDVYYVINSYEKIIGQDKDITRSSKNQKQFEDIMNCNESDELKDRKKEFYLHLKSEIQSYIQQRKSEGKPYKIIVTYDSFYLVKQILKELPETSQEYSFNKIQFIVDEFQSIFTDSTFKSSTELNYLQSLKGISRLCYVSATPMIEKYLRLIENFQDLPYYELDWSSDDPLRVKRPKLVVKSSRSALTTAKNIIGSYLEDKCEFKYLQKNGKTEKVYSKEAVIYMNSVNNILNVIKSIKLKPEQVNILCADTPENQSRIKRKLGKKFSIGRVPLKGEEHKQFTFCTRTVYLGADFYSTNARSFIISDANIDTLAVDISLDLPQILGRQRLIENPWKDEAEFYYKSTCNNKVTTKEELDGLINLKLSETKKLLSAFDEVSEGNKLSLAIKFERDAIASNYKSDYVAVNNIYVDSGTVIKKPVLNNLVVISEQRAFEIQQIDYADRFNMFSEIEKTGISTDYQKESLEFFEEYEQLPTLYKKLKFLCEYEFPSEESKINVLDSITEKHFKEYYETLGPEGCKSCAYSVSNLNRKLNIKSFNKSQLILDIYSTFSEGSRYTNKDIKESLKQIYQGCGYEANPKATDLGEYFEIKDVLMTINNKKTHGLELIKKKY